LSQGNTNPLEGEATLKFNPGDELELYEALPPRLRLLFRNAPVTLLTREFHELNNLHGETTAYELIESWIKQNYPEWPGVEESKP
jgi:hypothetical protein